MIVSLDIWCCFYVSCLVCEFVSIKRSTVRSKSLVHLALKIIKAPLTSYMHDKYYIQEWWPSVRIIACFRTEQFLLNLRVN